ncbi:MAG TPA: TonB-dependent receptor [Woeseiaceae bacterium]
MAFAGLLAGPVLAQDDSPSESVLEEILVTAQKRVQTLQDVPSSVSAITGAAVRDYLGSAENLRALTNRVPSLNIESSNGRTQPRLYIRGQGNIDFDNNASQPVGMVYDEIFLESNVLRSLPLWDIERVEVLAGPQGSLFGRNTNAGLVKIDSVRPTFEREGYVSFAYGERDTAALEFAIGGAVGENVAARLSVKGQRRSDWIDNLAAGTNGDDFGAFDELAYRLQFLVEGDNGFNGLFKIHGFQQDGSQPQVFYANGLEQGSKGVRPGFDPEVAYHDGAPLCLQRGIAACAEMELDHIGFAANMSWDVGDFTFTSVTGYDTVENFQSTDVDGGGLSSFDGETPNSNCFDGEDQLFGVLGCPGPFSNATGDGLDDHEQITQEFRLALDGDDSFWQIGFYYLDDHIDVKTVDYLSFRIGPGAQDIVSQDTKSLALFAQGEIYVNDRFSVTAGARVTSDDKTLTVKPGFNSTSPADSISVDDTFTSWDVAFTYDMTDEWSWYARVANASRGPVTIGRFGFTSSAKTETTNSVEVGFKSVLMDGRARWNTSLYSYTNDDQQLTATGGVANVNQLLNADKVNGQGFETSFEWLATDNFLIVANASYNDTEIDDSTLRDDLCGALPGCTPLDPIVGTRIGQFGPVTEVSIDGNPLPRTPEWTYNLILQYSIPVDDAEFYIHTDWNYRDDANLFLQESVEFVADSRVLGGLRIGYRTDNLDAALVGRNITDEISVDGGINFNNLTIFVNEPSFWGVEVRYDF